MTVFRFALSSDLPVPVEAMLATFTLHEVNAELWPLVRMTAPAQWAQIPLHEWPERQHLFNSWILLLCVLPIDRHAFYLKSVMPGRGFAETSSSMVNSRWDHERLIVPIAGGCRVTDTVAYRSRISVLGYLLKPAYQLVFRWRHRRLRSRFGGHNSQ